MSEPCLKGRGFVGLSAVSVFVHTQLFWGPKDFDDICLICSIYFEQSVGKEGGRRQEQQKMERYC